MQNTYPDRVLPTQDFNNNLYKEEVDIKFPLHDFLQLHSEKFDRNQFKLNEHHRVGFEEMTTPPLQLSFLKFLIEFTGCKRFLEIGTFIGNTTMHITNFIGQDAEVVTIEKFDEFADLAEKNFVDNNMDSNIRLERGDAFEVIKNLPDDYFDFIYVDGDKGRYPEITREAEKKLRGKGIILVDDVLFHCDVLNSEPTTEKGLGCQKVIEQYDDTQEFSKYLLPINNGILLLKKK